MGNFERGNVKVLDEERVQDARLQTAPQKHNVDTGCEHKARELDLVAVEQEAVAQGRVGLVGKGAWAQKVCGKRKRNDLDADTGGRSQRRDVVKSGEQIGKRRVRQDNEGRDIVDCAYSISNDLAQMFLSLDALLQS